MMPAADPADTLATLWRLVWLRWLLLAGSLVAVLAAPLWLGIPLPSAPLLLVLLLLAGFNALVMRRLRRGETPSHSALAVQVSVDLVALGVMLFLSGGAANPLVSLLLLPVASAALILAWPWAAGVAAAAIALYSLLAVWFLPLQIIDAARATRLHLAGMWLTFVVSVVLVAWLIVRMTASIRARDAALATAREQALRDERVVALGALAAGAAHELGTPLATIAIIAGELEHEQALTSSARDDLQLLRQQVAACKEIVTRLASRAGIDRAEGAQAQAADRWLRALLARWQATRPRAACRLDVLPAGAAPQIVVDQTLEQGVVNLLNNAADTASISDDHDHDHDHDHDGGGGDSGDGGDSDSGSDRVHGDAVTATLDWNNTTLAIEILDDGPGFPAHTLRHGGQTALPSASGGAGIGLLLTRAAIGRRGGRLLLTNRPAGGARARIELPLAGMLADRTPS